MMDIFKDAPAYKWMTEGAFGQGKQEGREERGEEELAHLRILLVQMVGLKFLELVDLASEAGEQIVSVERFHDLLKALMMTTEQGEARTLLLKAGEEGPQTH